MVTFSPFQYAEMMSRTQRNKKREAADCEFQGCDLEVGKGGLHTQIEAECLRRQWPYIHSRTDRFSTISVGAPDFIVFADRGRVFPIECKTKIGKLTPEQMGWQLMLGHNGHKYYVCRSFEQFLEITKD